MSPTRAREELVDLDDLRCQSACKMLSGLERDKNSLSKSVYDMTQMMPLTEVHSPCNKLHACEEDVDRPDLECVHGVQELNCRRNSQCQGNDGPKIQANNLRSISINSVR